VLRLVLRQRVYRVRKLFKKELGCLTRGPFPLKNEGKVWFSKDLYHVLGTKDSILIPELE